MTKYLKTLAIVASFAAATTAHAVVAPPTFTVYTDQTSWEAAVAGMKVGVEDFSDAIVPDFTINGYNAHISGGVLNDFATPLDYTDYTFAKPVFAFGANWNLGPQAPGSGLDLYVGDTLVGPIKSSYGGEFFGFVSTGSFSTVTVAMGTQNDIGEHYTVDNVRYAAPVPEPETYAMLVAGMGILGAFVRRRKQQD